MFSPFATKLGTNYCPSESEASQIKALIAGPVIELTRLDHQIAEMQNAINKLAQERDRLEVFITAHKHLISPLRMLPLEIIREIFLACLPADRNCIMSSAEAPVLLTQVCSPWRAIAHNTPGLWATLHIVEPLPTTHDSVAPPQSVLLQKRSQRVEGAKAWLARSGDCSLSLSFESESLTHSGSWNANPLLHSLLPLAARWERIQFTFPHNVGAMLRSLTAKDVPRLQNVSLYFSSNPQPEWLRLTEFQILCGPLVSNVCIIGLAFAPAEIHLGWNHLTDLSIGRSAQLTTEKMLKTMPLCPRLRRCRMRVEDLPGDAETTTYPVECAFLHTFELACSPPPTPTPLILLSSFSFPALRSLIIHPRRGNNSVHTPFPSSFFARSPLLETLRICSDAFSKSTLLELVHTIPPTMKQLEIFEVKDVWRLLASPLDDDILLALSPPAAPALRTLILKNILKISDDALLGFILSEMHASSSLKRIQVQFQRHMETDIRPTLQSLGDAGLDISITHLPAFSSSPKQSITDCWEDGLERAGSWWV